MHKYFRSNAIGTNFNKCFKYKTADQYKDINEWLENVFIVQNDNLSIKTKTKDKIFICDKRLGFFYSTMCEFLTYDIIHKLESNQNFAEAFLKDYFEKHNSADAREL